MSSPGPAIECVGLEKTYAGPGGGLVAALRGVDLAVARGEAVAITGPSGCGKTTLLNVVGALDRPTAGVARVLGQDLAPLDTRARALLRRTAVGFVFQQFHLIPTLTAEENVALPLRYAGVAPAERRRRATDLLARVGLAARADHHPASLSGGEQQRVALARALAGGAQVLLADEPTGNLDRATAGEIVALLREVVAGGVTLVLVTHDLDLAGTFDRQVKLRDGRVEA
ncbi:MAG: ABC transporter ATP-binding protein [Planctomycetes bacterium]|nr:ABC transporter ATP-binding protein [Planctomycetota bacterium]